MHRRTLPLVALALFAGLIVGTPSAGAATVNWSASFPTTGNVTVPKGTTAVLDTNLSLDGLRIEGTVRCGDASVKIKARWILVTNSGVFECGTRAEPFRKKLTITLTGSGNGNFNGFGDKYFVVNGGRLDLHGRRTTSWTRLAKTAKAGDTSIVLDKPVWGAGKRLVIAPTNYWLEQTEDVRVVARDGRTLMLAEPLEREHYCGSETYHGRTLLECAEVGLLSHNITIAGNLASADTRIGGHMMFRPNSKIRIENVALERMGQFNRLGRYPLHFHHAGDMTGSYIRNTSIASAYNRFVTIHDTHNVEVRRVVGYETVGHGFYLEDGIETGNEFIANLAVLVRDAQPGSALTPSDTQASGFWISNPDNTVRANVAAGVGFAGFWLAFPEHPLGESATNSVWPRQMPLREFRNNVAHTVGFAGLYIDGGERPNRTTETTWYNPRQVPGDPNSPHVVPHIVGFTGYKSRHYGIWMRTFSGVEIREARLADNWRSLYLANIPSRPSHDNIGLLKSSLLVGTSSNKGQAEGWEVTDPEGHTVPMHWDPSAELGGVAFYDGPMGVRNTTFANFQPDSLRDAGALTSLFPNPFNISVKNDAKGITFTNSKRVLFPRVDGTMNGDTGTMFRDLDGSVTGQVGAEVTVRGALLDTAQCDTRGGWNASICQNSPVKVALLREDGRSAALTLQRGGVSAHWQGSEGDVTNVWLNFLGGPQHVVRFDGSRTSDFTLILREKVGAKPALIAVPVVDANFTIWMSGVSSPQRNSYAALKAGGSGYWYDAVNRRVYFKLVEEGMVVGLDPT